MYESVPVINEYWRLQPRRLVEKDIVFRSDDTLLEIKTSNLTEIVRSNLSELLPLPQAVVPSTSLSASANGDSIASSGRSAAGVVVLTGTASTYTPVQNLLLCTTLDG